MPGARMGPDKSTSVTLLRTCRILGAVTLGLLAAAELTPVIERLAERYAEAARLAPAEAIVVLGGSLDAEGRLNGSSWRRLVRGILLYRQGLAPLLVLAGQTPPVGPSEPEVRVRIARQIGVPPAAILPETGADTTHQEGLKVGAALRSRGVRSILLVSGAIHLVRARAVFEREGFAVDPAPEEDVPRHAQNSGERLAFMEVLAQELVGRLYYRLAGYL
jgi:uncharacterized SAM-binding protein YcdF (DUF218 family)